YQPAPTALPPLIIAAAMLGLGLLIVLRERASRVSVLFFILVACLSIWQVGIAALAVAVDAGVALWWAKASHVGVHLIPAAVYQRVYLREPAGSVQRRRARDLFVAFCIGYLGSIDYLTAYGVPLYPVGNLAVFISLLLVARAVWRYRLVAFTPAFAAAQILET